MTALGYGAVEEMELTQIDPCLDSAIALFDVIEEKAGISLYRDCTNLGHPKSLGGCATMRTRQHTWASSVMMITRRE